MAESTRSPFGMWWAAAGIFLILVLAAAVFIGVQIGRSGGAETPETSPSNAADESSAAPETDLGGECNLSAADQSYPTAAPDTDWQLYKDRFTMPESAEHGPAVKDGDFWRCYSQTPTGALFAGIGLTAVYSVGLVYEAAADSPAARADFETQKNASGGNQLPDITGFRIDSYSESAAVVSYSAETGGIAAALEISLVWDESAGDWRLDLSSGEPPLDENFEESQFIAWSPNNE